MFVDETTRARTSSDSESTATIMADFVMAAGNQDKNCGILHTHVCGYNRDKKKCEARMETRQ